MQKRLRITAAPSTSAFVVTLLLVGCVHGPSRWDHRHQSLRQSVQSRSQEPEQVLQRAWANFMLGHNWRKSAEEFRRAASFPPNALTLSNHQLAWLGKGMLHLAQADFQNANEAFVSAIEADPQGFYAWISAIQLQESAHQVPDGHTAISNRLQTVLGQAKLDPQARRMLKIILLQAHKRSGNKPDQMKLQKQLGSVPFFRVAYSFGRHPLLAMGNSFSPESTTLDKIPKNRNQTIKPVWTFDRKLVLESARPGVLYAESFFLSTKPQQYCFRIQGNHSWSLFVDDTLVANHDTHHRHLKTVEQPCFGCPAGWHRVLLKIAVPARGIRLGVEMTLNDGRVDSTMRWWSHTQPTPHYQRDNLTIQDPARSPAEALLDLRDKHEYDALAPLLAGLILWEQGDIMAAISNFQLAEQRCESFCLIHYLRGLAILEDPDVPPGIDTVRSRKHLAKASKLCPDFHLAQFRLALLEAQQGFEEKALARLKKLKKKQPSSFLWPFYTGKIQRQLGFGVEADNSLRHALALLPDHPSIVQNLFERANEKQALAATNQLGQRLEQLGNFNEPISLWITRGDLKKTQSLLNKQDQHQPGRLSTLLTMLDLNLEQDNLPNAKKVLTRAQRLFPGNLQLAIRQANLLDRQGRSHHAQKIRQRYAFLNPWHISLRKALSAAARKNQLPLAGARHFDGLKVIWDHKRQAQKYRGQTVLLLDQAAVEVGPDGSSLEMVHTIAQILTPKGLERWGEVEALPEDAQIIELRTIKSNGRFFEAELIPGKESISMPALQVGDYVEIKYIYPSKSNAPLFGAYLSDGFLFELEDTAIAHSRYSVAVPKGTKLTIDVSQKVPKATKSSSTWHDIYVFEKRNTAPLQLQPHAPPYQELAQMVRIGFGLTWRAYRRLMFARLQESSRLTTAIKNYAKNTCTHESIEQNIRSIFRKVSDQIRQIGPTSSFDDSAAYTLARREGNRLVLLYALLVSMGLTPKVYLTNTAADAKLSTRLPSLERFSRGLLRIELDNAKDIWLDPSQRYNSFSRLYASYANMTAIEISEQKEQIFTKLPSSLAIGKKHILLQLTLSKDGTLAGTGSETLSTRQAVHYRELLHSMGPKQRRQAFETGLTGYFPGAMLEDYRLTHLDDPEQPLIFEYTFRAPGFARRRSDELILSGGFYPYQLSTNLITTKTRTTPLLLSELTRIRVEVRIQLPPQARIQLPTDELLTGPLSRYQIQYHKKDDSLTIHKRLEVLPGRVPVENYNAFRKFCRKVDTSDSQALRIQLPVHRPISLHSNHAKHLPSPDPVQYSELSTNQNQPHRK